MKTKIDKVKTANNNVAEVCQDAPSAANLDAASSAEGAVVAAAPKAWVAEVAATAAPRSSPLSSASEVVAAMAIWVSAVGAAPPPWPSSSSPPPHTDAPELLHHGHLDDLLPQALHR